MRAALVLLFVLAACAPTGGAMVPKDDCPYFTDADGDGYGEPGAAGSSCDAVPSGFVTEGGDCDDTDAGIHPGATELCNGVDDDCDGAADDEMPTWYADADGDGWGDAANGVTACENPGAFVTDATDCDDTDASVHPDAEDGCDGVDSDCDGSVDDDAGDADGDGLPDCDGALYENDFSSDPGLQTTNLGGAGEQWSVRDGAVTEMSNDGYSAMLTEDLGVMQSFTVEADVMVAGGNCNGLGLVFAWAGARNYFLARWQDPTGDYGSFPRGGNVDLYQCQGGRCDTVEASGGDTLLASYGEWVSMRVSVDGGNLSLSWNGTEVVAAALDDDADIGPGRVGFYSDDCDGGAWFDNLVVTSP